MSINATVIFSLITQQVQPSLLSEKLAHEIYRAFRYVLIPCTSAVGIVGNMTRIVILARQGFKKCSNVLLLALSVSGVLFLTGINNFSKYMYLENVPRH